MAQTSNTHIVGGSGQAGPYTYSFPILADADVKVRVNNDIKSVTTHYTLDSNNTRITFVSGEEPSTGDKVIVYRDTDEDPINSTFVSGSTIRSNELNDNFSQLLYIAQESDNQSLSKLGGVMEGDVGLGLKTKLYFEGDTDNAHETTITVVDPTADRTVTFPDTTGTVVTTGDTGTIVSNMIANTTIVGGKIANDTLTASQIAPNAITASELADDAVDSAAIVDDAVIRAKIVNDAVDGTKIADDSINSEHIVDGSIDLAHLSANSVDSTKIVDGSIVNDDIKSDAAIAQSKVDLDAELVTLAGMPSATASVLASSTALTSSTTELNQLDGKTVTGTFTAGNANDLPTSSAINTHFVALLDSLGGFVAIANDASFPNTNPDPSDNAGTTVSISDAGGLVVDSGGSSTTARTLAGTTVTITGFPTALRSQTIADNLGLQVQTTSTLNTYTYHKLIGKEGDINTLSNDINDFNARYRIGGSNPTSDNDSGDLFFNTGTGKMLVYDGTTSEWEEVQSVGSFFINTLSAAGAAGDTPPGGSATFNGTAKKFTLSNAGTVAEQHLVSINGVLQKPNAGTSVPSEGFAIDGATILFSAAPASGSDYFIVTIGSTVNLNTPSANSVVENAIQNNVVSEEKLKIHQAPSDGKFLKYTSANGMEWGDAGDADKITEGDSTAEVVDTGSNGAFKVTFDGASTSSFEVNDTNLYLGRNGSNSANMDIWLAGKIQFGFTQAGTSPSIYNHADGLRVTAAYNNGNSVGTAWQFGGYQGTHKSYGNINPSDDSTYSLGTDAIRWTNVYADNLYGDGSNLTGVASSSANGTMYKNTLNITDAHTIAATEGAHSVGPVSVGNTVTISGRWVIS